MQTYQFATTRLGLPILAHVFGQMGPHVLLLGGVHGNESEGVFATMGVLKRFQDSYPLRMRLTIVPTFNLEGVLNKTRGTSRGIDLNRNLPTKDWSPVATKPEYQPGPFANSEPENQALVRWIDEKKPGFIVSMHSWHPLLNVNGNCMEEAKKISEITRYKIQEDIGYPTPGCLGTYAWNENKIPTLTYEIQRGLAPSETIQVHVPAVIAGLEVFEKRHL